MSFGRHFLSSMTRITDLDQVPYGVAELPRDEWAGGDYVLVETLSRLTRRSVELTTGRVIELAEGDRVVGALGDRYATLEATGTWRAVEEDGEMEILTGGGVLGKCTSRSTIIPSLPTVRYVGHVARGGEKVRMKSFVTAPEPERTFETPTILVIGTSMSAGKTTAARVLVRRLASAGLRVLGAKVTGAGRCRDILTLRDAGADAIFDFVDAGLPTTVCPEEEYREALRILLSKMAAVSADVAVVEVGASPLEPYNGSVAVEKLQETVKMTVLCASDPYAVVGVREAFGVEPDLVTGIASNTRAGVELVRELTGLRCLNIRDRDALPELDRLLGQLLEIDEGPGSGA